MQDYMLQELVSSHISTGQAHIEVNARLRNLPISLTFTCPTLTKLMMREELRKLSGIFNPWHCAENVDFGIRTACPDQINFAVSW